MSPRATKGSALFPTFLGCVILLFVGILAYAYYNAKQANPVMLDERGQIRDSR